jgi:hypothetical protein
MQAGGSEFLACPAFPQDQNGSVNGGHPRETLLKLEKNLRLALSIGSADRCLATESIL